MHIETNYMRNENFISICKPTFLRNGRIAAI